MFARSLIMVSMFFLSGCFVTSENKSDIQPQLSTSTPVSRAGHSKLFPKRILQEYAEQFERCDRENIFNGKKMKRNKRCRHPNPMRRDLNKLDGFYQNNGTAIMFRAKMSVDVDGGYLPCGRSPTGTDQCPTTYNYKFLSPGDEKLPVWRQKYVTSDLVPYIVIPYDNFKSGTSNGSESREFRNKTGVKIGDVGVVLDGDKVVPVLVADGGPHNKIGEGSLALFDELGDTRCGERSSVDQRFCDWVLNYSLGRTVEYILFPNSEINDLTPSNTNEKVRQKALQLYNNLAKN